MTFTKLTKRVLLIVTTISVGHAFAAVGDVLVEYRSDQGVIPDVTGWEHEGRCLKDRCPDGTLDCYWQGNLTNNVCGPNAGEGCHTDEIHFNFPPEPTGLSGTCTYTEWIEFDDDGDNLEHPDTNNGDPTPKGAANFPGAPGYDVLRLVGGDGNGVALSLPVSFGTGGDPVNNRNEGKLKIRRDHGHTGVVTLVYRGALGEKGTPDRTARILSVRTTDGVDEVRFEFFHFSDNALDPAEPDLNKFGWTNDSDGSNGLIHDLGQTPPEEFFTLRIVCDPAARQAEIWLNEDNPAKLAYVQSIPGYTPEVRAGGSGTNTQFGLIESSDITVWVDYLEVLEGRVPPIIDNCAIYPVAFDVTGPQEVPDDYVDQQDLIYFNSNCATGPAPAVGVFDALSDRCKCMDRNDDQAVDQEDFGVFQRCYTGAEIDGGDPADPACDD